VGPGRTSPPGLNKKPERDPLSSVHSELAFFLPTVSPGFGIRTKRATELLLDFFPHEKVSGMDIHFTTVLKHF